MTVRDGQRETWERLLAEQQASGLSAASWCRDHDIDKLKFYYWRKRLVGASDSGATSCESAASQWLAVGPEMLPTATPGLTLRIGRIAVEIGAVGFDPRLLADVLAVLEAREQR